MSQNRSSAVMEQRAAASVETDDEQRALYRKLEYFPTPPWAARAGAELISAIDPKAQSIWEPACGEGHILYPLREYFEPGKVIGTDIHSYGHGSTYDFLSSVRLPLSGIDWVMTNPPFPKAAEFVSRGLDVADRGVAVLCRMAFLESATRYPLLFQGRHPLTVMAPFIERVPMQLGSWDPQGSTATAYAWFVFSKCGAAAAPIIMPIPPGTRTRLTRPDDAARFGARTSSPLFDGGANAGTD
jgi:hypothetical protein